MSTLVDDAGEPVPPVPPKKWQPPKVGHQAKDITRSNMLQGLDLDDSSLATTAKQIKTVLRKRMLKNLYFFRQLDDSEDGWIDKPEFVLGFKELGLDVPEKYFEQLFDEVCLHDTDFP